MNIIKYIFLLLIFFLLFNCAGGIEILFHEPQPVGTKNITYFPKRLQGKYISLSDHSTLLISEITIRRIVDEVIIMHKSELDSNFKISGDTLFHNDELMNGFITKRIGDSLEAHFHYENIIFQINNDNILRKFKGYYFLNSFDKDHNGWSVQKIELSKGQLTISHIDSTGLNNLKKITELPQDTIGQIYNFKITRKQFKEIIKSEGFGVDEVFIKLNKKS